MPLFLLTVTPCTPLVVRIIPSDITTLLSSVLAYVRRPTWFTRRSASLTPKSTWFTKISTWFTQRSTWFTKRSTWFTKRSTWFTKRSTWFTKRADCPEMLLFFLLDMAICIISDHLAQRSMPYSLLALLTLGLMVNRCFLCCLW